MYQTCASGAWAGRSPAPLQARRPALLRFQDSENGKDRGPAAGGGGDAEDLVETAKMADGLHVTAIHSKYQPISGAEDSDKPLSIGRNSGRAWSFSRSGFR